MTKRALIPLWMLVITTLACTIMGSDKDSTEAPTLAGPPVVVAPTSTLVPTRTPFPTAAPPPSPTTIFPPTVDLAAGAQRIAFARSTTSTLIDNQRLPAGSTDKYVLGAQEGQQLSIQVFSAQDRQLKLLVQTRAGRTVLTPQADDQQIPFWIDTLPRTGDYVIEVSNEGGATATYNMQITIPSRITFDPGAVSETVEGRIVDGRGVQFVLSALQGQTMFLEVESPNDDVLLSVWGAEDEQPYLRSVSGKTEAELDLPRTQDYLIGVVSFESENTSFELTVTVIGDSS